MTPSSSARIVIDANNPIKAPLFKPAELHGRASSEVFAGLVRARGWSRPSITCAPS